jgi:hypothetical protein
MNSTRRSLVMIAFAAIMMIGLRSAQADQKADRAVITDALTKISTSAAQLAQTAKASDDRGARKKFAPAALELSDDLAALARRSAKDVPLKAIGKDAAGAEKDSAALIELADEAEDKEERKALRAHAVLLGQAVTGVRKYIDQAAAKADEPTAAPAAPAKFTGRLFNNSNSCSWEENVKFLISANGTQVFASGLVFPGKDLPLVLHKGSYLVQVTDTVGKLLAQGTLAADREGWIYKSGCVNQD